MTRRIGVMSIVVPRVRLRADGAVAFIERASSKDFGFTLWPASLLLGSCSRSVLGLSARMIRDLRRRGARWNS